jgi:WD40 repeat protein
MKIFCGITLACMLSLAALGGAAQPVGPRLDRHGDPLPKGALQRLGTLRYRQPTPIVAFVFAPDGKTYATTSYVTADFAVYLWQTSTGRLLLRCEVAHGRRHASAFAGDDKNAAPVRKKGIEPLIEPVLAFAPDGKTVAAAASGDLVMWDTTTGRMLRHLPYQLGRTSSLAWSADGKTLAIAGRSWKESNYGPCVHLIDGQSGQLLRTFDQHRTAITNVTFSPDGKRLLIRSTDEETLPTNGLTELMPGRVCVYDAATGKPVHQLDRNLAGRHSGLQGSGSVAWTRDLLRIALLGRNGRIEVWDLAAVSKVCELARDGSSCSFAFTPDGKRLVVGEDGKGLNLWDAATGKHLGDLVGHGERGCAIAGIDPTGKYLATMLGSPWPDHFVRLWDLASGQELTGKAGHQGEVVFARPTADGKRVLTAGLDGTVRLWDSATGQPVQVQKPGWPRIIASSLHGTTLVAGDHGNTVAILEGPAWKTRTTLKTAGMPRHKLVLAPQGDLAAVCHSDTLVGLYESHSGKKLLSLRTTDEPWAFSPDSQLLATQTESGQLRLWHVRTGKAVLTFQVCQTGGPPDFEPTEHFDGCAFTADGRWLATSHNLWNQGCSLRIWEIATGKLVQAVRLPGSAYYLAFAPDSRTVAASITKKRGQHGGACFWDAVSGRQLGQVEGHDGEVTSMAFAPDGRGFLTGGSDSTVLVWDVAAMLPAQLAAPKKLTPAECNALWEDLAGNDAHKAYHAIMTLTAGGQDSVTFLQDHLRPAAFLPPSQLEPLVADLDNPQYAVRAKAMAVLSTQGERAALALRQALKEGMSLEMRRRVELLLAKLESFTPPAPQLQQLRALAVLEHVGDDRAAKIIEVLAGGAPEARLTHEARAALLRLGKWKGQ